ncbi:pentatricopeptide repeat-containing protein At5g39350 [Cryptomeria japonica]|uniref:pentatricopeptide repeat-containing protein At5g39350 n=1 Tax=Cryptomeria japonica TaxID=3369 RepID=UPI0027D9DEB8|nr:pentatricopeptide repeat-containing protein At5g39350 [Cryptomeria japonica]
MRWIPLLIRQRSWRRNLTMINTVNARSDANSKSHEIIRQPQCPPSHLDYVSQLRVCIAKNSLADGKLIHAHINERGFMSIAHKFLHNILVNMYAKCGSLVDARKVFDEMPERDVCSWTVMITAYARQGSPEEALRLFYLMQRAGVQPNHFTFATVVSACTRLAALEQGREIHQDVISSGLQSDVFVVNALIDMYAKCGSIEQARRLFEDMPQPDIVSWTAIIAGYVWNGLADEAEDLFKRMQFSGFRPNLKTYASVLPACAELAHLGAGMAIHGEIIKRGLQSHLFVGSNLVNMYAKCGDLNIARDVFDEIPQRDNVSWTVMIAGYAQNGWDDEVLQTFQEMQEAGVETNSRTFTTVLSVCAKLAALEEGIQIHGAMIRSGVQYEIPVVNCLIHIYAKCGSLDMARKVLDKVDHPDVLSWTAMVSGYAQNERGEEALELFQQMQRAGVKPISQTFACALSACASLATLGQGMEIHEEIIIRDLESDVFVGSALMDMYIQCGSIEKAHKLFNRMKQRDTVSWTLMIAGYAQKGWGEEALRIFQQMLLAGILPNAKTFACVLPACADLVALEQGMGIHEQVIRSGFKSDVIVTTALIDMYAKCGRLHIARHLFDRMHKRDVVSWTAVIAGYAMHGRAHEALSLFEQMKQSGIHPNHVTLLCVLSACCHAGLVNQGWQYFKCISEYYHITPKIEHYGCMVDLIGRAGHLHGAQQFVTNMPIKPDAFVWRCLLGACVMHSNVELGEFAAEQLFELKPTDAAPYVLLSNIYAVFGRWDDIEKIRKMMRDRGVKKTPGCSWIEVNKHVHAFVTGGG